jgi:sigma-B regulation protein RsbU (phosphoserine phosphatase)
MFRNMTIAGRMTLLILVGAGCILGAIIGYSYVTARRLLEQELREKACHLATATAGRIETVQRSVEKVVQGLSLQIDAAAMKPDDVYALLDRAVRHNSEVFGAAFAPAPGYFEAYGREAPYVCRPPEPGGPLNRKSLAADNYQYDAWDWYTQPRDLGRAVWTEPYFDEGGGNVLMVTYSVPCHVGGRSNEFLGIVTSDVSLAWLADLMDSLDVGKQGYAFLVTGNGTYIAHPRKDLIMKETVFSAAESTGDDALREYGNRMLNGETGFGPATSLLTGNPSWLAFAPVPSTHWSVGLVFPKAELLGKVVTLSRDLTVFGVIGFALLLLTSLVIARSISRPLQMLEAATRTLSTGNLDTPLPRIPGDDEVARLARSFDVMRRDLRAHIDQLRTTTAAKERIESEIQIARSIQMSLVPRTFPPFPERDDIELFALLDPARDIGGDFYDFFMAEDDHLCLVIGDVSGKGVPAALFMAVTRTFLRMIWNVERDPAATLTRLNNELARDNEPNMFVTLFCARIHLPTGRCVFANGGHNPPFILHGDGSARRLPKVAGTLIGAMEDMAFEEGVVDLKPGDTLFLYTDGVTEALNPEEALAGEDWTLRELEKVRAKSCESLVTEMREALRRYAAGSEQSDDITMVAFRPMKSDGRS